MRLSNAGGGGRAAAAVAALTLIGKAAGFGRELLLARYFGATKDVDALLLAMTPASALVMIVGESLRYSTIPDLSAAEAARGLRGFWGRARAISTNVACLGLALSLALGVGARAWVAVLARAAPPDTRSAAVRLAPILAPVAFAALWGNVLAAVHSARGYVVRASAAELSFNAMSVPILLLFASAGGVAAAAWGSTAGYLLYALLLALPFLGRRLPRSARSPERRGRGTFLRSTVPMAIAAATIPVTNVIDRAVASGLPEGSIAALNYAFKIVFLPLGIVVSALGTVGFPRVAKHLARGDGGAASARVRGDSTVYVAIMVPAALLVAVLALPATRVLFERGAFDRDASRLTARCLQGYAGAIAAYGLTLLLGRVAVAGGWLRVPVTAAVLGIGLDAILDVVLARLLGAPGIGLAFSIASAASLAVLVVSLGRRLPGALAPASFVGRVVVAASLGAGAAAALPSPLASPLLELFWRGGAALLVVGLLYQVLGVFRSCASSWSGPISRAEARS
jgi:putative peptidoglycan lipid II flippase